MIQKIFGVRINGANALNFTFNLASLAVLGLAGVGAQFIIGSYYNTSAIGSFNQVFAIFLVAGQIGALGIHLSTQKYLSEYLHDRIEISACLLGGGVLISVVGLVAALCYFFCAPLVGRILESDAVVKGIQLSAPGLLFFILNKLSLSALNGLHSLKAFAFLQAARPILLLSSLVVVAHSLQASDVLPYALTVSEGLVCICSWSYLLWKECRRVPWIAVARWIPSHWSFGARVMFGNILIEMNTRIDIIILGLFMDDAAVGIYSFAAILVEGFAQLPGIGRIIFHAKIVQLLSLRENKELQELISSVRNSTYLLMSAVVVIAIVLFPWVSSFFVKNVDILKAWKIFGVLMAGVFFASGYMPFGNILLQGGKPGGHSIIMLVLVSINILGNLILIPYWGVMGSAVAAAVSFAMIPFVLRKGVSYFLSIKIP